MKKHIIIAGLVSVIMTPPALAVTKCVALNSNTTCTYEVPRENIADWTSTCTTNGVSTPIKGIGICSANAGSSTGATTTELEISSTAAENRICWCKMTSPAVSRWVFNSSSPSAVGCARYCGHYCANNGWSRAAYLSAMFGSLSD